MNRALFFIASIVVATFAADASPDLADADVRVLNLAVEGLKSCPPCTYNCAHGFKCQCGSCVPIYSGPITDCNHGYSYDFLQRRCVPVTCDAPTACPSTAQTCIPEERSCTREPCPQYKCVYRVECPSCATLQCPANSICKCGKCEHVAIERCPSCALVRCGSHAQCKCGKCLPIERECERGEEYDSRLDRCVAVSCSAPNACSYGQSCVPKRVDCVRSPCPQFECQARPTCGYGEEYDYHLKHCVAVSCNSPHACDRDEVCVPHSLHCLRAPCPQFSCRRRFHYYAAVGVDDVEAD